MPGQVARRGALVTGACIAAAAVAAPAAQARTTYVSPKAVSGCGPSNPAVRPRSRSRPVS